MKINGKSLTLAQVRKLRSDLDAAETKLKAEAKSDLRTKIDAMLESAGLDIADIYPAVFRKKRKIKQRYANPDDRTITWSGIGHQPWWVKEHIAGGGRLDDLAI